MKEDIIQRINEIKEHKIPNGYVKSKIGILPAGWDVVPFNKKFSRLNRKNDEDNQNVLTISAKQGLISRQDYYTSLYASENKKGYYLLYKGNFVYNKSYSSEYLYGAIKKLDKYTKGIVSPLYICFEPKKGTNSEYYSQYFEFGIFNYELYKIAQEGARNHGLLNISITDFFNTYLIDPPVKEQEKIAEILVHCDKIIELQENLINEFLKMKKALLQKMFPKKDENVPKVRFPGFTDDWEQRKLGEIADIVGGGTPITSNADYWGGDIDWYAPAEIAEQIYVSSSEIKITQQGFDNSSAKMLPAGTVLFTSRAGIGKTAILRKKGCTNQGFQSIVPHENTLDSYFIFSRSEELKRYGETVGAGSIFVEVSGKQMASMELMMPTTMEEQKKSVHYSHVLTPSSPCINVSYNYGSKRKNR